MDESPLCFLCGRFLGRKVEWHHVVPKCRGGRDTAPVHPICHRAIHRHLTNQQIARDYARADALRAHPEIAKFISWVADKDPDFHAPTRRKTD
jgi:hypothetical protein